MVENPFLLDFHTLVAKADAMKRRLWGDKVFFVRNLHLNYTNICVSHCKFCAFAKNKGENGAYCMTPDDAIAYVAEKGPDTTEIHVVGGLHPEHKFSYYIDMVSALKTSFPEKTVKAFSAVEIDYFARISGLKLTDVLKTLKKAGVSMLPGGGAEIFSREVRNKICPEKIPAERYLAVHEAAHGEGITTNATMLYSHLESDDDRLDHLMRLRHLQEKTGGFSSFVPLSFRSEGTFLSGRFNATGVEDIRVTAASRIVLDNFPHIKAYWVMLGNKTAQIALRAGADDLDGTVVKENIAQAAGGITEEGMTAEQLAFMVKSAGLTPVERDSLYKEIKIYG